MVQEDSMSMKHDLFHESEKKEPISHRANKRGPFLFDNNGYHSWLLGKQGHHRPLPWSTWLSAPPPRVRVRINGPNHGAVGLTWEALLPAALKRAYLRSISTLKGWGANIRVGDVSLWGPGYNSATFVFLFPSFFLWALPPPLMT